MTRKNYIEIAELVKADLSINRDNPAAQLAVRNFAMSLTDVLKRDNPRFDRQRFYDASGISELRR